MIRSKFYFALLAICSVFLLAWHSTSHAAYPDRTVRIIVTFGVGGGSDVLARLLGQKLSERWGQPVVIENRAGANGTIGLSAVVNAKPDGYTLVLYSASHVIAPYFIKLNYDPIAGVKPVAFLAAQPDLLVVSSSLPVHSVKELIALAKAKPGTLFLGSSGPAITGSLTVELLKSKFNLDIDQVVYKDGTPVVGLLSGDIQLMSTTMSILLPQIKAGKVRPLAVSGTERVAGLPDVPTMAEATGVAGFERGGNWYGLAAPLGTPDDVVETIYTDVATVMNAADFQEAVSKLGMLARPTPPKEFEKLIKEENAKWGGVIKSLGIQPQ